MPEQRRTSRKKTTLSQEEVAAQLLDLGRVVPQAPEIEAAVIGACLNEQEAFPAVSDILKPDSFYDSKHRAIYTAIQSLAAENKPIDLLTVTEQLRATDQLDAAGGPVYMAELSQKVLSSAHVEFHAHIVAQKSLARQLITYTSNIQRDAFDEGIDVAELMQRAEGELFELSRNSIKKDFTQIDPVIREAYEMLEKAMARTDGLSGLASGFHALDAVTSGWQNSDLIIIAARPAMGKTAFVLSMCKNMAVDMKIPVAMFSLEMSNVQLVNRLITNVCEIPGQKIKSGQLLPYEVSQLDMKLNDLYGAPLYIDDTPSLSVFELRTKARRLVRDYGVKIIFIDYLQLMNASGMAYNSRQEEVSTISRNLKALAKELNIPIIALSQLNRAVENRVGTDANDINSKRPQLSDLRESGAIEQDADMVCFIHRPEYYHITKDQYGHDLRGTADIIIAKHRNGEVKDVRLRFTGEYARFSNMGEETPPPVADDEGVIRSSRANRPAAQGDAADNGQFDSISPDMAPAEAPPF